MATITERPISLPEKKGVINKKLAAALLAGSIAVGGFAVFQSTQNKDNSPQEAPIAGNVGNETNGPIASSDVEIANNNEQEQTVESFGVNTWLNTLTGSQKAGENDKFFNFNVENREEWESNIQTLSEGNTVTDPLKASWLGGYTSSWANEGHSFVGHKVSGEIEFNNISIASEAKELTAADLANGYEYKGSFTINYAERFYNYYYEPSTFEGDTNKDNVVEWINKPEAQDENFSEWQDGFVTFPVAFKNGEWTTDLSAIKQEDNESPRQEYNEFLVPFDLFYTQACGPYEEFSCRIVEKNPPYK